jgi:hypothetical protein
MNEENKKVQEAKPAEEEKKTATTINEFLSGLVEIGKERQGIRYTVHAAPPAIKQQAAS